MRVLIADDDRGICGMIQEIVEGLGHSTSLVYTAAETLLAVEKSSPDLVMLDLRFPDCTDLTTLEEILSRSPSTDVIMVTAETDDLGLVRQATRLGAFDYVPKPIREDDIRMRVTRVSERRSLVKSHARAMTELAAGRQIGDIIGKSPAIQALVRQLQDLALYDTPVVITGETGTGKELLARALHYEGPRRKAPFVSINCAALPLELTESELFGHEKGAFTGAQASRKGAFEEAGDGTIFLDEIGDMNLKAQAVLLQVLESGEYRSVGGKKKKSRARVVMATNQDLEAVVSAGKFREDLYYRANRVRLRAPPLRERKEDIPELAQHFLYLIEAKVGKGIREIVGGALEVLKLYDWPGNVRELRNEIERAHIRAREGCIRLGDLSEEILFARLAPGDRDEKKGSRSPGNMQQLVDALKVPGGNAPAKHETKTFKEAERQAIAQAIAASGGQKKKAAELLGVSRQTLYRKLRRLGLESTIFDA